VLRSHLAVDGLVVTLIVHALTQRPSELSLFPVPYGLAIAYIFRFFAAAFIVSFVNA